MLVTEDVSHDYNRKISILNRNQPILYIIRILSLIVLNKISI